MAQNTNARLRPHPEREGELQKFGMLPEGYGEFLPTFVKVMAFLCKAYKPYSFTWDLRFVNNETEELLPNLAIRMRMPDGTPYSADYTMVASVRNSEIQIRHDVAKLITKMQTTWRDKMASQLGGRTEDGELFTKVLYELILHEKQAPTPRRTPAYVNLHGTCGSTSSDDMDLVVHMDGLPHETPIEVGLTCIELEKRTLTEGEGVNGLFEMENTRNSAIFDAIKEFLDRNREEDR
jgi:hypothetical protein